MGQTFSQSQIDWMHRLHREGVTAIRIARRMGLREHTVYRILARPPHARRTPGRPRGSTVVDVAEVHYHTSPDFKKVDAYRCIGCWNMVVYNPCVICRAKRTKKSTDLLTGVGS
jgi:hypothetical protein